MIWDRFGDVPKISIELQPRRKTHSRENRSLKSCSEPRHGAP